MCFGFFLAYLVAVVSVNLLSLQAGFYVSHILDTFVCGHSDETFS